MLKQETRNCVSCETGCTTILNVTCFLKGRTPRTTNETQIKMMLSDKDLENEWGAKIVKQSDSSIVIRIFTPPDCYVGKWKLKVTAVCKKKIEGVEQPPTKTYEHPRPIYILFNPWCKGEFYKYLSSYLSISINTFAWFWCKATAEGCYPKRSFNPLSNFLYDLLNVAY